MHPHPAAFSHRTPKAAAPGGRPDPAAAPLHRILVVDDSQVMRLMVGRILRRAGYRVETAENGKEALEKALAAPPQLVLMDVTMPVMNGWEATHRMRSHARLAHIPVVMLSCNTQEADIQYAFSCGAHSYLTKPIAADVLLTHVGQVLASQRVQRPIKTSLADCSVLVVDHEGRLGKQIGDALGHLGCRIFTATSGAEAVWLAMEHVPDLVLMDRALPFGGGEAAQRIRALHALRHIPILALAPTPARAASGVTECLSDPFTNDRLLERVVSYLVDRVLDAHPAAAPAYAMAG